MVHSGDWGGRAGEARRVLDLRAGVTIPHTPVKITRWVDIIEYFATLTSSNHC